MKCFKCHDYGHISTECPKQKSEDLLDIEAIKAAIQQKEVESRKDIKAENEEQMEEEG